MATGFASVQRVNTRVSKDKKTLFERITEKTNGEKQSFSWYKNAVKEEAAKYKKDTTKVLAEQRGEKDDENFLRMYPVIGHLYMFEYKAKMRWLPYYDRFPLVYVIKMGASEFWGANLHYLNPKKRILTVKKLMEGRIDVPKACIHKYINAHVNGYFLDLAANEWDTAILLPIEDFVKDVNGNKFPYDKELVWEETAEKYYDSFKARRVIGTYGKTTDKSMAQ